jgi:hypothetical protein
VKNPASVQAMRSFSRSKWDLAPSFGARGRAVEGADARVWSNWNSEVRTTSGQIPMAHRVQLWRVLDLGQTTHVAPVAR